MIRTRVSSGIDQE